jgi:hypothetical protein
MAKTPKDTAAEQTAKADPRELRRVARLAKQINAFAKRHGGTAEGSVAYIGAIGTRILLVGADGGWGDLVAPSYGIARQAVEQAAITVHEDFDGDYAARVSTGPYEWKRMAGIQLGG